MNSQWRWALGGGAAAGWGAAAAIAFTGVFGDLDVRVPNLLEMLALAVAVALTVTFVLLVRQTSPTFTFEVGRELGMRQATQCPIIPDRSASPIPLHSVGNGNGHPRH
jgi:hypothetical protein